MSGHSGRKSFVTNAIDIDVSDTLVAQASKHKDPHMQATYHMTSLASNLAPALNIGEFLCGDSIPVISSSVEVVD